MVQFHRDLARLAAENGNFHYHYVTAREMVNLVRASSTAGASDIDSGRDFALTTCDVVSEVLFSPT
jgi:hypothetical protein